MKKFAALLCLLAAPAAADHLYPEPSTFAGNNFFSEYDREVATVLEHAMDRDVVLRMIEIPSFIPESAVWIGKDGGQFKILALAPKEPVWGYKERHKGKIKILPNGSLDAADALDQRIDHPKGIPLVKCAVPIAQGTEQLLARVWESALLQVRYGGSENLGADGAFYHFAMRKGVEFLAGTVWSPAQDTTTGKLVMLGYAMRSYCETRTHGGEDQIKKQAADLLRELQ